MDVMQGIILRALMVRENWDTLSQLLNDKWFASTIARRLFNLLAGIHAQSTTSVLPAEFKAFIIASINKETEYRNELLAHVDEIATYDIPETPALRRIIKRFYARSLSLEAAQYIAANVDEESYDPSIPGGLLTRATEMSVSLDSDVVTYENALQPDEIVRSGVIGYGFSDTFDGYLDGGKGPGELSIYMAVSGVGKTSMLLLDAMNAAKLGKNVLYVTKEINKNKCVQRLDQCLTNMDKNEMTANPAKVMAARKAVPGDIWIKDWSHTRTTVADIRALILQMKQRGENVDFLIVDYMELLEPEVYNKAAPRLNFTVVVKDLRALANELWIPISTAWQANRAASNKMYLSKEDAGEDWNVIKTADIVIGLNQNQEELKDKIMRINVIKQRESTCRAVINLYADLDRMIIREHSAYDEEEAENVTGS